MPLHPENYNFTTKVLTLGLSGNASLIFPGRSTRLTLIISQKFSNLMVLSGYQPVNNRDGYAIYNGPQPLILTYRDLGPLIQQPLWTWVDTPFDCTISEIYEL